MTSGRLAATCVDVVSEVGERVSVAECLAWPEERVSKGDVGMTQPPGWYPAEGDPPGTHRYWDGSQWTTDPQPIGGGGGVAPPPAPAGDIPTLGGGAAGAPPLPGAGAAQSAPGAGWAQTPGAAAGWSSSGTAGGAAVGQRAEITNRLLAHVVDALWISVLFFVVAVAVGLLFFVSDPLAVLTIVLVSLASIPFGIYVIGYAVGVSGQSPGKRVMGVKVVNKYTGDVIGGGRGVLRMLVDGVLNNFFMISWIWALIDQDKQTLADKVVDSAVIEVPRGGLMPILPKRG